MRVQADCLERPSQQKNEIIIRLFQDSDDDEEQNDMEYFHS